MKEVDSKDEQTTSSNDVLPAVIFLPEDKLPERDQQDEPESIEVGVIIEGEHYKGYYNHESQDWYVHFGGITVGHRLTDDDEIEGWYYLVKI